jgi:hypothetical protein
VPYLAFFVTFWGESSVEPVSYAIWEIIYIAINLTGLIALRLFPVGILEGQVFQKNQYTIPELKTAIQSKAEATSTEILTKVLNDFALRFRKFVIVEDNMCSTFQRNP